MWRSKTEGWAKLSKKTLQAVDNTRNHLDKLETQKELSKENIGLMRGNKVAGEALMELGYIQEALSNFEPDSPKYYRGN